jgi:hypothetical protein
MTLKLTSPAPGEEMSRAIFLKLTFTASGQEPCDLNYSFSYDEREELEETVALLEKKSGAPCQEETTLKLPTDFKDKATLNRELEKLSKGGSLYKDQDGNLSSEKPEKSSKKKPLELSKYSVTYYDGDGAKYSFKVDKK